MRVRFVAPGFSETRVRRSILAVLRDNELCSISTVRPSGRAHINTAFFAYSEDLELYFLSNPQSVHCRNLANNPSLAMTIFRSDQGWAEPGRGLQLFGTAREARGSVAAKARGVYGRQFPKYRTWSAGVGIDPEGAALLRSYRLYRFVPNGLKVLDEAEFGGAVTVWATVVRPRRSSP